MALTQEAILSFLLERGGKVKNSELLNHFRSLIHCVDPAEKQHNRDLFKKLVNSVAVVKQIDEVKFVVVKRRYQEFVKELENAHRTQLDESWSENTSFNSPCPRRAQSVKAIYSDIENNNASFALNHNGNYYSSPKQTQRERPLCRSVSSADTTTVKVLNLSGDQASRAGKTGAVFAVIAVKSPQRDPSTQGSPHTQTTPEKTTTAKQATCYSLGHKKDAVGVSQCWTKTQTEDIPPPNVPQVRTQNKRQGEETRDSESVPLEPVAHEWLVNCAAGRWGHVYALLLRDTRLVQKKDFISGFTALHWAAKDGNADMVCKLMDIPRKRGISVNINSKAHGGYTPLHIAAVHGHADVMLLLVQRYGANVNERDNDGKKAGYYLSTGVSAEVRGLLGGQQPSKDGEKTEEDEYREHSRGFNTISKLFQPHTGRKHKNTKLPHEW